MLETPSSVFVEVPTLEPVIFYPGINFLFKFGIDHGHLSFQPLLLFKYVTCHRHF